MFGRPDAVAAKKVVNVLAGAPEAKARVRPLLEIMGRGVMGERMQFPSTQCQQACVVVLDRSSIQDFPKLVFLLAVDVGDDPRLGSVMKLAGNFNIASAIELIGEGMTLAERSGLSRDNMLQFYSYMLPGARDN